MVFGMAGASVCWSNRFTLTLEGSMQWTKPEAEVVAVTMEVTAYVATL